MLIKSNLFFFCCLCFMVLYPKKPLPNRSSQKLTPKFSSKNFLVLAPTIRPFWDKYVEHLFVCLLITNISFLFLFFLSLFINIYLFLAVLGLCCCKGFFSNCGEWGLLSRYRVWAPRCGGFSCCRAQAPGCWGFSGCSDGLIRGAACGLQSSVVVAHRFSCPMASGIFPD